MRPAPAQRDRPPGYRGPDWTIGIERPARSFYGRRNRLGVKRVWVRGRARVVESWDSGGAKIYIG